MEVVDSAMVASAMEDLETEDLEAGLTTVLTVAASGELAQCTVEAVQCMAEAVQYTGEAAQCTEEAGSVVDLGVDSEVG